jgi:hypothetical protein
MLPANYVETAPFLAVRKHLAARIFNLRSNRAALASFFRGGQPDPLGCTQKKLHPKEKDRAIRRQRFFFLFHIVM